MRKSHSAEVPVPAKPSAVERAERILGGGRADAPAASEHVSTGQDKSEKSGNGLLRGVAYGYVLLAEKVQAMVDPLQQNWQQSLSQARQEREQQIAQTQGPAAAQQEEKKEKRGEKIVKKSAGGAAEAAGDAGEAAAGA